jgi:1,4-dihydroxy-2-naphthoyl-CoA hydrolase
MEFELAIPYEETLDGFLGLEFVSVAQEKAVAKMPLRPGFTTAGGWLQSGVPAAIAESMASIGTAAVVAPQGSAAMGKWNDTALVAPVTGDTLTAEATAVAVSDEQWLWDVRIADASGALVATSRVAIAVRPQPRP